LELNKKNVRNILLVVVLGIVLYWILHEPERADAIYSVIAGALGPFALGATFAFILNVPMRAFERLLKGIKQATVRRVLALALSLICFLLVLTAVFILLIPQLIQTIQTLIPRITAFLIQVEQDFIAFLSEKPEVLEWVKTNIGLETFDLVGLIQNVISMAGNSISTILSKTLSAIGTVTAGLIDTVIALIFSVYCLFQKERLARTGRKLVYAFLPEKYADAIVRVFRLSNQKFSNFLSGQCIEVCILGVLFAIAMSIFRMPYIPLICVTIAVLAFIPIVGSWIAGAIGAFFILIEDPGLALIFIIMFIVIQQLEGNLIYPRVVGNSIGLSGMWVLMAVGVGGELMGVGGMVVMIPAASVMYTLFSEYVGKRLKNRQVDPDKLIDHPPQLRRRFSKKKKNDE